MIRVTLVSLFLLAFASIAGAQCLICYTEGGTGGTCGESVTGYCSGMCCGNEIGAPCHIPDSFWQCNSLSRPGAFKVALFKDDLPPPRLVPTCRFASQMISKPVVLPRRAGI